MLKQVKKKNNLILNDNDGSEQETFSNTIDKVGNVCEEDNNNRKTT